MLHVHNGVTTGVSALAAGGSMDGSGSTRGVGMAIVGVRVGTSCVRVSSGTQ